MQKTKPEYKKHALIYGAKGSGKIDFALSIAEENDKILVIVPDHHRVRNIKFQNDCGLKSNIEVFSIEPPDPLDNIEYCVDIYNNLIILLETLKKKKTDIDFLILNGFNRITWICEMTARNKYGFDEFDYRVSQLKGFRDQAKLCFVSIAEKARMIAKKKVIWTLSGYQDPQNTLSFPRMFLCLKADPIICVVQEGYHEEGTPFKYYARIEKVGEIPNEFEDLKNIETIVKINLKLSLSQNTNKGFLKRILSFFHLRKKRFS